MDLQTRIDSTVRSAIDRIVLDLVFQIASLWVSSTPTIAGIDTASQLQPPQVSAQWPTDGGHLTLWDNNLPQFPQVGLNRSRSPNPPTS